MSKAEKFIRTELLETLENDFKSILKTDPVFKIDEKDKQTILFYYPRQFSSEGIVPAIRLEIGPLAACLNVSRSERYITVTSSMPGDCRRQGPSVTATVPPGAELGYANVLSDV